MVYVKARIIIFLHDQHTTGTKMLIYFVYVIFLDYTALGNMPIKSSQCVDDCTRSRDTFETTPIMSTYLLAFVVADFEYTETIMDGNYTVSLTTNG